jgi:hypothetical protein
MSSQSQPQPGLALPRPRRSKQSENFDDTNWTAARVEWLIDAVAKVSTLGAAFFEGKQVTKQGWKQVRQDFQAAAAVNFNPRAISSKFQNIKTTYTEFRTMLDSHSSSGWGCNSQQHRVASGAVWDAYLVAHPKTNTFVRAGVDGASGNDALPYLHPPPHFDKLDSIFNGQVATGRFIFLPGLGSNGGACDNARGDVDLDSSFGDDDFSDEPNNENASQSALNSPISIFANSDSRNIAPSSSSHSLPQSASAEWRNSFELGPSQRIDPNSRRNSFGDGFSQRNDAGSRRQSLGEGGNHPNPSNGNRQNSSSVNASNSFNSSARKKQRREKADPMSSLATSVSTLANNSSDSAKAKLLEQERLLKETNDRSRQQSGLAMSKAKTLIAKLELDGSITRSDKLLYFRLLQGNMELVIEISNYEKDAVGLSAALDSLRIAFATLAESERATLSIGLGLDD